MPTHVKPHAAASHASHSRFVQRVRRRYAAELHLLPPGTPGRHTLQVGLDALQASGLATPAALRVLRQLTLERLAVLDCEQATSLDAITRSMTELAELALDVACQLAFTELDALHGAPLAVGDEPPAADAPPPAHLRPLPGAEDVTDVQAKPSQNHRD